MSKITKIVIGIVILIVIGIWYGVSQKSVTEICPIKIGFIGPLTGDASSYGVPFQNAVMMAEK